MSVILHKGAENALPVGDTVEKPPVPCYNVLMIINPPSDPSGGKKAVSDVKSYCLRLHRGDDLLEQIEALAQREHIKAGAVVSAVGCVSRAAVRDAGGVRIRTMEEPLEIVSLMGTVSAVRCHLHISFSREDLSTIGGHLVHGCVINTTCELVIVQLPGWNFGTEQDAATGYDEIVMEEMI